MTDWVARKSDKMWQLGETGSPHLINSEPDNYKYVDLPRQPDPRLERWDGANGTRAATQDEIDAYDAVDPVKIKKAKHEAAKAVGSANPQSSVKWIDLFDLLGIE